MQYTCFSDGPTFSASNPFKYIIQHTGKLTPYLLLYPSIHILHTNWSQPQPCWNTYRSRFSRATKKPSNQVSGSLCKCKMNQNDANAVQMQCFASCVVPNGSRWSCSIPKLGCRLCCGGPMFPDCRPWKFKIARHEVCCTQNHVIWWNIDGVIKRYYWDINDIICVYIYT